MNWLIWSILGILGILFLAGIRIIRPTHRGTIETLGKYTGYREAGFTWVFPVIQSLNYVNITEKLADVQPLEMITKDNLNAKIDLQVYYKVKPAQQSVFNALYNVDDVELQMVALAQTTARNIIGGMPFKDVNSKRDNLNDQLFKILDKETKDWGIQIVRVELKEITPPEDVQETMNKVIKAENEKDAAIDFATAKETQADGIKRATIKEAEGVARGRIIVADANAYKIKIENEAARKYFKGNAQKLKQYEVAAQSLERNSKIILGSDSKNLLKLFDIGKA